jgi:hypothetical protein
MILLITNRIRWTFGKCHAAITIDFYELKSSWNLASLFPHSYLNVKTKVLFFFFFLQYWGLNSGPTPGATPLALFCGGLFQDRVSETICSGWF